MSNQQIKKIKEYINSKKEKKTTKKFILKPIKISNPNFEILKNDLTSIQNYLKKCKALVDKKMEIPNLLSSSNKNLESIIKSINLLNENNLKEEHLITDINQSLKEFDCSSEKESPEKIKKENELYNSLISYTQQIFILLNTILDINYNNVKESKSFFANFEIILDYIIEKYSKDKEITDKINCKTNFEDFFFEEFNKDSSFYKCITKIKNLYFQNYEKIIDIFIDLIANVLKYDSGNFKKIKSSVHSKIGHFEENFTLLRSDIEEIFKNMKEQNENLNKNIIQLNEQIKVKEEQNGNLNRTIIQLNEQIKGKEEQNENLNRTISQLNEQLKEKEEQNELLNQTINHKNEQIKEKEEQNELLNQTINQINEQIKEREEQNEFLKIITRDSNNSNNNNNLKTILNQIKDENLEFLNKINEFRENQNKNLEYKIKEKEEEVNEILAINRKYSIKIKVLQKENELYKNNKNIDTNKLIEEYENINNEILDNVSLEKKNDLEKMNQLQRNINKLINEKKQLEDLEKLLLTKINELDKIQNINV